MARKTKQNGEKKNGHPLPEFIDRLELKHEFSDPEKVEILTDLSRRHEEKESLTAQKKSSAKQWQGKIDEVQLKINELSMKGRDGFEMRPTDVRVVLDKKRGKKTLFRKDTGELIEDREMTTFDYERLPMELPPETVKNGEGLAKVADALDKAIEVEATEVSA
jgi:hypothetical protein